MLGKLIVRLLFLMVCEVVLTVCGLDDLSTYCEFLLMIKDIPRLDGVKNEEVGLVCDRFNSIDRICKLWYASSIWVLSSRGRVQQRRGWRSQGLRGHVATRGTRSLPIEVAASTKQSKRQLNILYHSLILTSVLIADLIWSKSTEVKVAQKFTAHFDAKVKTQKLRTFWKKLEPHWNAMKRPGTLKAESIDKSCFFFARISFQKVPSCNPWFCVESKKIENVRKFWLKI